MRLKHCLNQGMSKAGTSRRFGAGERTIRRWIAAGRLDAEAAAGRVAYSGSVGRGRRGLSCEAVRRGAQAFAAGDVPQAGVRAAGLAVGAALRADRRIAAVAQVRAGTWERINAGVGARGAAASVRGVRGHPFRAARDDIERSHVQLRDLSRQARRVGLAPVPGLEVHRPGAFDEGAKLPDGA